MTMRRRSGRALALAAAGFLFLDAALLALAGAWLGRFGLVLWAVVLGAGGLGVIALWRRYLRELDELDAARAALRDEVRALHQVLDRRSG